MLIDTHCHPFSANYDSDREEVLNRAREAGIKQMLVVGYNFSGNRSALNLVNQSQDMLLALGVHPCDAQELNDEELIFIKKTAQENSKLVAIGEMGLDYYHMTCSKEVQEEAFRKQIRLANELSLPCIVHSRDSAEDTLRILLEEKAKKAVFHCYSYDYEFAKKVWENSYYTSFSGMITYPKAEALREALKMAPKNLILLETDAPYLPPQSKRGKRNEPAFLQEIAETASAIRGINLEEIQDLLVANWACFLQK